MSDTTPNLALPELIAAQAQKHVTHNEALLALDTLVQLAVLDRDLTAPPSTPDEGERWLVAAGASGAWAAHDREIAAWVDGGWDFFAPKLGWLAYVIDESALIAWDGTAWQPAVDVAGVALQNMSLLGVGTTADTTNPFSAKLNNVLWTGKTMAEGGDGNLRYKMSKESSAKTLSLLFQDNFSGRAEFGLTGDDDFHVKVSSDGTTWREAIVVDRATGVVSFPQGNSTGDLDLTLAELALGVADALNVAQFMGSAGNRFADSFDALTFVDTAGATNLDSATAGLLKPTVTAGSLISTSGKTKIGNMTGNGGIAAAFDGNTNQANTACALLSPSNGGYNNTAGVDWGAGVTKTVGRFKAWAPNNFGILGGGGGSTLKLQGSNDNSSWTDLYTTPSPVLTTGTNIDISSGIVTTSAYRYHRINISGDGANGALVAEVEFYEAASTNNVTVSSTVLSAAVVPASMKLVARVKFIDSITLGTDLNASVSRDGGTTWTAASLIDRFTSGGLHVLESAAISVSAQPSGSSVKWKVTSANNKAFELHDVYLYWT